LTVPSIIGSMLYKMLLDFSPKKLGGPFALWSKR